MDIKLHKYFKSVPRYTSYPAVPFWQNNLTEDILNQNIAKITKAGALYIHIPFCYSLCTFCACNKIVTKKRHNLQRYIDSLILELKRYNEILGSKLNIAEIHIGGGTPSFLSPAEMSSLMNAVFEQINLQKDAHLSIELDSRSSTKELTNTLASLDFKRISFGIQDVTDKIQKAINRVQSSQDIINLTNYARGQSFESINYDLLYGLPFQDSQAIEDTVAFVGDAKPDRIAFYGYAHVPWVSPGQRGYKDEDLPKMEKRLSLFLQGREGFKELGYKEIAMDHFALESDGLYKSLQAGNLHRNFMGYTERSVYPLIGLGISAISDFSNIYYQNTKDIIKYMDAMHNKKRVISRSHILTEEEKKMGKVVLNLMTKLETHFEEKDIKNKEELNNMQEDGLIEIAHNKIKVTSLGLPFVRNIAYLFDPDYKEGFSLSV